MPAAPDPSPGSASMPDSAAHPATSLARPGGQRTDPYRVLARTYRPQRLSELIGQEALVRTLTNALRTGRIAHAFLLTGIRGVGKTTTARIIARALNCIGADGQGQPTPEPCGVCANCVAIAEGRHIDVLEMDAATRTGIDDVRELVDSVRYAPTSARFKVYIVDEVHMLSEKAFNGLLKTLEEPPPQTIFVFATTEVRKVPVTVLSRCQRFDLRRVEGERLRRHLAEIAAKEGVAGRSRRAGAPGARGRGLGARRPVAARSGDRAARRRRRRGDHRGAGAGHAGPRRPRPGRDAVRAAGAGRRARRARPAGRALRARDRARGRARRTCSRSLIG